MTLARANYLLLTAILNTEDARPMHALPGDKAEWDRLIRGGFVSEYRDPWRAGAPKVEPRGRALRERFFAINRKVPALVGAGKE